MMKPIYTATDALDAVRDTLTELADAEKRFDKHRATYRKRHPDLHPDDANREANKTYTPVVTAIVDWQTAHTRLQSYAAVATALLLAERRPSAAWDGLPAGHVR